MALVKCNNYDETLVSDALKRGIALLGGISGMVKPGEKILLKPNLLSAVEPSRCVTTHPSVFKAAAAIFQAAGAKVFYGDSPAFGSIEPHIRKSGLKAVADELGVILSDFENGRTVSHKNALQNKQLFIANGVLETDGLVSLSKMKTHAHTRFTGAVKNQFGCIPGMLKPQYHVKLEDPYQFAKMLVDINTFIKPRLFIMDGIMAMEGNGPSNGKPRAMNVLLFSRDPVALDAVACKLIDLNPEYVPTSIPGEKSGLGTYHYENIEVVGDTLEQFIAKDFQVVKRPPEPANLGKLRGFVRNQTTSRPYIDLAKCTGCGTCIKICPVGAKALAWVNTGENKRPQHNYKNCIRCYCCQEMCPEGAITVKTPFLGKLIFRR